MNRFKYAIELAKAGYEIIDWKFDSDENEYPITKKSENLQLKIEDNPVPSLGPPFREIFWNYKQALLASMKTCYFYDKKNNTYSNRNLNEAFVNMTKRFLTTPDDWIGFEGLQNGVETAKEQPCIYCGSTDGEPPLCDGQCNYKG